jgi:hypothetical protein
MFTEQLLYARDQTYKEEGCQRLMGVKLNSSIDKWHLLNISSGLQPSQNIITQWVPKVFLWGAVVIDPFYEKETGHTEAL